MIDFCKMLNDMVRGIVDHPDDVKVTERTEGNEIILTLNVAQSDMGMVIGKHGNIARAVRTVMKAAAKLTDKKLSVEIR